MEQQEDSFTRFMDAVYSETPTPAMVTIELTQQCNARCLHCFQPATHDRCRPSAGLPTPVLRDLFGQLAAAGCMTVALTGGEPLLRPDFRELIVATREADLAVVLMTNGILFDPETVRCLAETPKLIRVEMSLLGARAETVDHIMGLSGAHAAIWQSVRMLREAGIAVALKMTGMVPNIAEMSEARQQTEAAGAKFVMGLAISPLTDTDAGVVADLRLSEQQLLEHFHPVTGPLAWFSRVDTPPAPADSRDASPPCNAGHLVCYIDAEGEVRPCLGFASGGNIRSRRFADIWQEGESFRRFRPLRQRDLPECSRSTCEHYALCQRCPARALLEHGHDLGKDSEACKIARMKTALFELLPENTGAQSGPDIANCPI